MDDINRNNLARFTNVGNIQGAVNIGSITLGRCRLCACNVENMITIFSEKGKQLHLAYRMNKLLPIMITPMDRLPQEVCNKCINEMNVAFEFVKKCMRSQAKLQNTLNIFTELDDVPIEVLQDYSAHWSTEDNIDNIEISEEHQNRRSERSDNQTVEDDNEETERNSQLKTTMLIDNNERNSLFDSSESLDGTDINEMDTELPFRSMDSAANDGNSVNNSSMSKINTTEDNEHIYLPEERQNLDECRISTDAKHICKYCDKGFPWKADLFEHQTIVHPDLIIRCGYCLKVFYDRNELESHELAHTKLSQNGYKVKKHIQFHSRRSKKNKYKIKNYLGVENESDIVCYYCNITFTSVKMHRNHNKAEHRLRMPCRFCSMTCTSTFGLKQHENRHRKRALKNFVCSKCEKLSYFANDHRNHELMHMYKDGLKCEICGESFLSEVNLEQHITTHDGESSYLCETCGQNLESFYMFRIHKMSHLYPDFQSCEFCFSCFYSIEDLEIHLEVVHKRKLLNCNICEKPHMSLDRLKEHKDNHDNTTFICKFCGKTFTTMKKLKNHAQIHSSERNYLCEKCGKGFKTISSLQNHRPFCQNTVSCSVCERKFVGPRRLKVHMRLHTGQNPYLCAVCGKGFHASNSLKQHMLTHKIPKVPCPICGILFVRKAYMFTHMKRHRVPCETCGKVFANTPLLLAHQQTHVESGKIQANDVLSKGHQCDICGKMFVTPLDLKKHKPMHSEDRPFKCSLCVKSYRRLKDLAKHTKNNHDAPKPYQCRYCTCTFIGHQKLLKHENGHTDGKPYVCQECGIGFWSPLSLEKHITKHTVINSTGKMYKCKYCEKSFSQKSSLVLHMQSHSAHLPYGCSFCPRKFSHARFMKTHLKKCALNPYRQGKSSSVEVVPLQSFSTLNEEPPKLVSDCITLQNVQPEVEGGGGETICTESIDFLKHLKRLVKNCEIEKTFSGECEISEEEMGEPVHPQLLHSDTSKNIQLVSDIPVYISKYKYNVLSQSTMSSTTLARKLLEEVFTEDALLQCSVKGQTPNSKISTIKREPLFSPGTNAIILFVQKINELRGRPPIKNAEIVAAMGHRLNEIRKVHATSTKFTLETLTREATEER